jgi:glutamate/tyrosine decarboxylase-like PLP-dependent enzyme
MDSSKQTPPLGAWFLGPKAENSQIEEEMILYILRDYFHWRRNYFPSDKILISRRMQHEFEDWNDTLFSQLSEMLASLRRHFPFYSPRYIGHMVSDQTLPSVLGYFAAMLYNPNNVTPEAGPITIDYELEVGADVLKMLGYTPPPSAETPPNENAEFGWAHITSGGTVANLEAFWVARTVRYFPLAVRWIAQHVDLPLEIRLAGETQARPIQSLSEMQVLGVQPDEAISLLSRVTKAIREKYSLSASEASDRTWELLQQSGLSIAYSGVVPAFSIAPPAIFVSSASHYSVSKSAEILGIGRDQIISVDVDSHFRIEMRDLEQKMRKSIEQGMLPLSVIAIVGTTEEGAVDPIHEIVTLRERLEQELHSSFWLHVDAAWGGYIRSVFVTPDEKKGVLTEKKLWEVSEFVSRTIPSLDGITTRWGNNEVGKAFLAIPAGESVTIDPHKMGYIPYPSGVVVFRHDRVRQFLTQEAPYITMIKRGAEAERKPPVNVGAFILEGSKPGAAAAGTWLSHRVIPPNREGYGHIVRNSLLAARELYERLLRWEPKCQKEGVDSPIVFIPVSPDVPDTNIVCFVVKDKSSSSLAHMNAVTQWVYKTFTIESELGEREYSYSQPFFLSRTRFEASHYSPKAMAPFLERAGIEPETYPTEGIFVLRSTVMNPYIVMATENGGQQDYLADFMVTLAQKSAEAVIALRGTKEK